MSFRWGRKGVLKHAPACLLKSCMSLLIYLQIYIGAQRMCDTIDAVLTILKENCSLERMLLRIWFTKPFLLNSQHQAPIRNQLPHLLVTYYNVEHARALISHILLQRGTKLEIDSCDENVGLKNLLPCIPTTYLGNLMSTTSMESCGGSIEMLGPNGSFSFSSPPCSRGSPYRALLTILCQHLRVSPQISRTT